MRARRGSNRRRARRTRDTSPLDTLTFPASLSIAQVLRRGVRGGGLGDAPTRVRGDVARVRAPGTRRGDESTRRTRRFGRQSAIHDHEHRARVVMGDGGDGCPVSRRFGASIARARGVLFFKGKYVITSHTRVFQSGIRDVNEQYTQHLLGAHTRPEGVLSL